MMAEPFLGNDFEPRWRKLRIASYVAGLVGGSVAILADVHKLPHVVHNVNSDLKATGCAMLIFGTVVFLNEVDRWSA